MRTIVRIVLITGLAVAGMTATAAPAMAGKPATQCEYGGQWYPHGWSGELGGRWMECSYGVWHMM